MTCRICLESSGTLISPCNCRGTSGYIHKECLEMWMNESNRQSCEICQYEYNVTEVSQCSIKQYMHTLSTVNFSSALCRSILICSLSLNTLNAFLLFETSTSQLVYYNNTAFFVIILCGTILQLMHKNTFNIHNTLVILHYTYCLCFLIIMYGRASMININLDWCDICHCTDCNKTKIDCDFCNNRMSSINENHNEIKISCYQLAGLFMVLLVTKLVLDIPRSKSNKKYIIISV